MYADEDNQVNDEVVLEHIARFAKPTVTLSKLKESVTQMMDENDMRKALGRLWRAVKVFRCPAGNQVVYWTEATAKAAASSGLTPEMPPGVEAPECTKIACNKPKEEAPKAQFELPPVSQLLAKDFVASNKEEKIAQNKALSNGRLIPISQTAAQMMAPLAKGESGKLRRGSVTAKVATVMFKYRDVRLSIDAVMSLCIDVSRVDVARVLSQLSGPHAGQYFVRHAGATRFDSTFQWNDQYRYPFVARYPDDGNWVPLRNVDDSVADEPVALDHVPPEELSEDETESEIARLMRLQMEAQQPKEQDEEESVCEKTETETESIPAGEATDESVCVENVEAEDSPTPIIAYENYAEVQRVIESVQPEVKTQELEKCRTILNGRQSLGLKGPGVPVRELHVTEHAGITVNSEDANVLQAERRARKVTISDQAFKAGIFTSGEMVIHIDGSMIEFTKEQTDKLIDLLGPMYLARKAA